MAYQWDSSGGSGSSDDIDNDGSNKQIKEDYVQLNQLRERYARLGLRRRSTTAQIVVDHRNQGPAAAAGRRLSVPMKPPQPGWQPPAEWIREAPEPVQDRDRQTRQQAIDNDEKLSDPLDGPVTWLSPFYGQQPDLSTLPAGQRRYPVKGELFMRQWDHYRLKDEYDEYDPGDYLDELKQRLANYGLEFQSGQLGRGAQGAIIQGVFNQKAKLLTKWEGYYLPSGKPDDNNNRTDHLTGRPFAAKLVYFDPEWDVDNTERKRIYLEKEIMKRLASHEPPEPPHHPNIVQYLLAVNLGPRVRMLTKYQEPYYSYQWSMLVMELGDLGDLKNFYYTDRYTPRVCMKFIQQILWAIDYLHLVAQVCHRDIKVDNVVVFSISDGGGGGGSQQPTTATATATASATPAAPAPVPYKVKLCDFGYAEIKSMAPYRQMADREWSEYLCNDKHSTAVMLKSMLRRADPQGRHLTDDGLSFFRQYADQLADQRLPVDMELLYAQNRMSINRYSSDDYLVK
ncbi:uncharacterized protein LOC128956878 [Oppia nitens]|uniref:uncharacterized protein LOC128956878 n=1 Tax=Oppia nitens TaxID=1686743 RepID=UPI0023DB6A6F|nr:uncharacterized protein LOC128956878 [Oppia nitens]